MLIPWKKNYDKLRQCIKKQRPCFADKGSSSQSYGLSSSQVWMWELDHKESWAPENLCFWAVVLEKILESPLDCKEIQPVNPKGISPEYSFERTDVEAEAPILWPPDARSRLIEKTLMLGKVEGRRRRGWQKTGWLDGITDLVWAALGVGEGQGSLACYSPWGCKKSDKTERLKNNK